MAVKVVSGDLILRAQSGEFDLIAHGCNCFCSMGAGLAEKIAEAFPEAQEADEATEAGDWVKLGTCTHAQCGGLVVVNAYTQYDYQGDGVLVDYEAVRSCMRWIRKHFPGRRIGLPKIGAGLAGGDWERIEKIIEEELGGEEVTVVEYRAK